MKWYSVITGLITMLFAAGMQATTLKLAADVDLLVLDGHKISGSLLKGADGLELGGGEHQLLFQVEKTFISPAQLPVIWTSVPQIVTFTARSRWVVIQLPQLQTLQQGHAFDQNPRVQLVDEQGKTLLSQHDQLPKRDGCDPQQAMDHYNRSRKAASVPRFAQSAQLSISAAILPYNKSSEATPSASVLYLWYSQFDSATRQRLVMLMSALHTG